MPKPPPAPLPEDAPDDASLFRAAIGPVRELPAPPPPPAAPKRRAEARQFQADEQAAFREAMAAPLDALAFAFGEPLAFRLDQVPPRDLKRLKRGEFAVQDELDLHALTLAEAESLLRTFLVECRHGNRRCVRVIHGKGLRSPNGPVMKAMCDRFLRHCGDVLAFASAPAAQGGSGAVLVLLKREAG
jgi:DNA-nicking Smr family endonuclease